MLDCGRSCGHQRAAVFSLLVLFCGAAGVVAAQDPCPSVFKLGTTFYPLDCVPFEDETEVGNKDFLEASLDELISLGWDGVMGQDATGNWACTIDGATIWIFKGSDNPAAAQAAGLAYDKNNIALRYESWFGEGLVSTNRLDYLSRLMAILLHEIYHTVFYEWLAGWAVTPSVAGPWQCLFAISSATQTHTGCMEAWVYSESARNLCSNACEEDPGSDARKNLMGLSNFHVGKAALGTIDCLLTTWPLGPCPPPQFPPSSTGGDTSGGLDIPPPCCCQDGVPVACENCNELTGDCDDGN